MPSKSKKQWLEETLNPAMDRFPERQSNFHTDSDINIEPLYDPEDLESPNSGSTGSGSNGFDYHEDLGYPGEFPYS